VLTDYPLNVILVEWEKNWVAKMRTMEENKWAEQVKEFSENFLRELAKGSVDPTRTESDVENTNVDPDNPKPVDKDLEVSEVVGEVGEDFDLDIELFVGEKLSLIRNKVFPNAKELSVSSVLQSVLNLAKKLGELSDAIPLLLLKCFEMDHSGLSPLTAFGTEEQEILSLILSRLLAMSMEDDTSHSHAAVSSCAAQVTYLIESIRRHHSLDLTSLAIETLNMDKHEALRLIDQRLVAASSSEQALSIYESILEDQSRMKTFLARHGKIK
jgi:hypothetical protein